MCYPYSPSHSSEGILKTMCVHATSQSQHDAKRRHQLVRFAEKCRHD